MPGQDVQVPGFRAVILGLVAAAFLLTKESDVVPWLRVQIQSSGKMIPVYADDCTRREARSG